jgi:hypothetical protein
MERRWQSSAGISTKRPSLREQGRLRRRADCRQALFGLPNRVVFFCARNLKSEGGLSFCSVHGQLMQTVWAPFHATLAPQSGQISG